MYKTTLFLERFCLTPCYRWRTKIVQECNILERFCVNLKRTSFSMCCSCTNIKECIKWSHHDVVLSTLWNDKQSNRTILVTIRCTRHWVVVKLILHILDFICFNLEFSVMDISYGECALQSAVIWYFENAENLPTYFRNNL